jgi:hypothetical protein
LHRGQRLALAEFLPLRNENWITCGNALRLDWLSVCPPTGTGVKLLANDLFETPLAQAEIDFENEGGETYLCGNPPYQGSVSQSIAQKNDMALVFSGVFDKYKDLDYVAAFLFKAAAHNRQSLSSSAFVTTNSVVQGEQVALLWPLIFRLDNHINFAHTSFKWSNLASHNAGVTCVIIGLTAQQIAKKLLYDGDTARAVDQIGPYLLPMPEVFVEKQARALHSLSSMDYGNKPTDGGHLLLTADERVEFFSAPGSKKFVRQYIGAN